MSRISGIYSNRVITSAEIEKLRGTRAGHETHEIVREGFYAILSGLPPLCTYSIPDESDAPCCLVSGIAMARYEPVTISDWLARLSTSSDHPDFDGQYCGIHYADGTLRIFTDHFNNRPFYVLKRSDAIFFSTEWMTLKPFMQNPKLDMKAVGSYWLMNGQYGYDSFIQGLQRSEPASFFSISKDMDVRHEGKRWIGMDQPASGIDLKAAIDTTVTSFLKRGKVSLGMSGGTDSRMMLAFFMQHPEFPWRVHTFGELDNPEVEVVRELSRDIGFEHQIVDTWSDVHPSDPQEIFARSKFLAAHTEMTYSIRAFRMVSNFSEVARDGSMVVDGDYGCFIRDYFLNGIDLRLKFVPRSQRYDKLFQLLTLHRPNFFEDSLYREMKRQAKDDFYSLPETLPEWDGRNYTDLIALLHAYYRYPNLVRNWNIALSIVPLVSPLGQASLVREILRMPKRERANCRLSYPMLRELAPQLVRYPLVRNATTIPFQAHRNFIVSAMIAGYKMKKGFGYRSRRTEWQLGKLREIVLSLVDSAAVRECPYYDYPKVRKTVTDYYQAPGEARGSVLMQWLGFELFRSQVED